MTGLLRLSLAGGRSGLDLVPERPTPGNPGGYGSIPPMEDPGTGASEPQATPQENTPAVDPPRRLPHIIDLDPELTMRNDSHWMETRESDPPQESRD